MVVAHARTHQSGQERITMLPMARLFGLAHTFLACHSHSHSHAIPWFGNRTHKILHPAGFATRELAPWLTTDG